MRRILLLPLLVACLALSSWGANKSQPVTVAQLDRFLAGARGQSDDKIAKNLEPMVLTERVPAAQLAQWQSALSGRHSRELLTAMADVAMLLPLPPAGVLPDPPPDIHAQGAIFSRAIDYVADTLDRLPDFSATRTTRHFEDDPAHAGAERFHSLVTAGNIRGSQVSNMYVTQQVFAARPMHFTSESSVQVSYREGVEMRGTERMDLAAINQPAPGLQTAGEFGPILSVVLKDALHGSIDWAYWQQGPLGRLAVFRYAVPDGQSSYVLALRHGAHAEKLFPAYHGEIAIDPDSGAILRITLDAGSPRSQYVMESTMVVEYGPVAIGGKVYVCPLKGVALLKTIPGDAGAQTEVNDASFTGYHLLRGDVTILPAQP